ncbi:endoplasmic reticulum protein [Schizopora paradoxa]|uniref:Endoplasmic reticulum transmembrane protein n=1 Tax=Schizopora paradoxa TaxID=27342 RepID=A0A0H2SAK3_9AGAM|nr:endoplasmic reticulum protein [Schizopora paradoxa]
MTLHYSLTFMLLAAEMATFVFVVAPLPYAVRRKVFTFLSESYIVSKLAYGLKISFIFVGVLFLDAMQRMYRISAEAEIAKQGGTTPIHDARAEASFAARKFYAQRNVYLTGFCLFLSLILARTFYIILDFIHTQDSYLKLQKEMKDGGKGDQTKQIAELKAELAAAKAKARDFEVLRKQAQQQQTEYDRLATEYNKATGSISDKRKD